jgi:hypothetical protein
VKYLYLIYLDESKMSALSEDELQAIQAEAGAHVEQLEASGRVVATEALAPVRSAATLRSRNGKLSVTDGPFAETNEQLGGFVVIEARDLNDAIQVAANDPAVRLGSVEVRPILPRPDEPAQPEGSDGSEA